jgi:tellurite resistance protein TerC
VSPVGIEWAVLGGTAACLFGIDAVAASRSKKGASPRSAALASVAWVVAGLTFAPVVWILQGATAGGSYLSAYIAERILSVDNVTVFALVISSLALPAAARGRVLRLGVAGAVVLRLVLVLLGVALVSRLWWIEPAMGVLLVASSGRLAAGSSHEGERLLRRAREPAGGARGERPVLRHLTRRSPVLVGAAALVAADVVFALDSVPTVVAFAPSQFPALAATVFSVLGLAALTDLLSGLLVRLRHLKAGLSASLVIVGAKLVLAPLVEVPAPVVLAAVAAVVVASVAASLRGWRASMRPPSGLHRRCAPSGSSGLVLTAGGLPGREQNDGVVTPGSVRGLGPVPGRCGLADSAGPEGTRPEAQEAEG